MGFGGAEFSLFNGNNCWSVTRLDDNHYSTDAVVPCAIRHLHRINNGLASKSRCTERLAGPLGNTLAIFWHWKRCWRNTVRHPWRALLTIPRIFLLLLGFCLHDHFQSQVWRHSGNKWVRSDGRHQRRTIYLKHCPKPGDCRRCNRAKTFNWFLAAHEDQMGKHQTRNIRTHS